MVKEVVQLFGQGTNLLHHRTVVICLLGFSGFLRISELLDIQIKHLTFLSSHLEILILKAKNDQLRQGHIVHIKRLNSQFCPVQWLQAYLDRSGLITGENNYIISRLAKSRSGHRAYGYKPLAESTVRDIFNKDIAPLCDDTQPGDYSLHSMRSGGASAAINHGVSERLIGKHGRWKSGFCRDRYLKDGKKQRLEVTQNIGLWNSVTARPYLFYCLSIPTTMLFICLLNTFRNITHIRLFHSGHPGVSRQLSLWVVPGYGTSCTPVHHHLGPKVGLYVRPQSVSSLRVSSSVRTTME